jgi:transposase
MAGIRMSIPMQKQILELHAKGFSARKIAKILKKGRNTVRAVLERAEAAEPGDLPEWAKTVDWQKVRAESSRGVQLNILAREYAEDKVSYSQFCRQFRKVFPGLPVPTMRLEHKPGEKCFFDYGDGIDITNPSTGEVTSTSFLCGVMAMSSMTYGEFTLTQKRDDLVRAMENAFRYFGGVTPYVTVDNQKAAVTTAHWYDPDVNPAFIDFANHWGFAVIPARPERPRDKAGNEAGIGVVQRQFFPEVRNQTFYSLDELNRSFWTYLKRLNMAEMKDWGVSRVERFAGEKHLLKACPTENWELAEWRISKVHADCHVQVAKKFYSVPYKYIGREVRVRITVKLIEVFDQDLNPLAAHAKLVGRETHSTDPRHYPEEKVALVQFSVQHAIRESEKIGSETSRLIKHILGGAYPLRYLRRAQGILRLYQSRHVTREALEHACKMGMTYQKTQFPYIQSTVQYFDKNGLKPSVVRSAPIREKESIYLHGYEEEK